MITAIACVLVFMGLCIAVAASVAGLLEVRFKRKIWLVYIGPLKHLAKSRHKEYMDMAYHLCTRMNEPGPF